MTVDVQGLQADSITETPFGSVGIVHQGPDLQAWWIWKDGEDIDPALSVCDREDLLHVVRGALRLELAGREPVVLRTGETFTIPAGTPFRGYRWPREGGEACLFLAVAPADAGFTPA